MAPTFTAVYQFAKADPADMYDVVGVVNANWDKAEAGMIALAGAVGGVTFCTSTTRPGSPVNGRLIYETDTRRGYIWTGVWTQTYGPPAPVALTMGATIATNIALGRLFRGTATANGVLQAPTNPIDGADAIWEITADATPRTISLQVGVAGGFIFGSDITALTATEALKTDLIGARYHLATNRWRVVSYAKGFAAS